MAAAHDVVMEAGAACSGLPVLTGKMVAGIVLVVLVSVALGWVIGMTRIREID